MAHGVDVERPGGDPPLAAFPPAASLADFMKKWSIDVGNNMVVDASGVGRLFGAGPSIPLVTNYSKHKITEHFNVMTFFPLVRSVANRMKNAENSRIQLFTRNAASREAHESSVLRARSSGIR